MQSEAGKGSKPREGRDDEAYRNNYDLIFRKPKTPQTETETEDESSLLQRPAP